ncbi:hypothetical protein SBADM41S_01818 [Streptomyces badius]
MSSYSTPVGKAKACSSQKVRRKTLLQAMRSPSRIQSRVTWVAGRAFSIGLRNIGDCSRSPLARRRRTLPVAKSEPERSSSASIRAYAPGGTTSSLSTNVRNSASGWASRTPALRAAPSPAFSCRISRKRGSRSVNSCASAGPLSVEPSSTRTTSRSGMVCSASEVRQAPRYSSTL